MPVKPIRSAARTLEAVEVIARHQPIGVGELARQLGDDKSNVQRVLVTLASAGWIEALPEGPTRWALTTRVQAVASDAQARTGLGSLIRSLMVSLRDRTGETVISAVPDVDRVVITDVVESTQMVRSAPPVGFVVPTETSASGCALLAAMDRPDRERLVGHELADPIHKELDAVRRRGWSLSIADDVAQGSTNLGAAVLGESGAPIAAIAISAVSSRMPPREQQRVGEMLAEAVAISPLPELTGGR
ncbi:MAG: helix-turn-helix domain-containing protein [Deltaproteobacteria bacterium]|jgi:IclR family acetate operon transcriptional repressor|nr:helix-turn-helix domain-containing protein [Deltaproteobacteria bacterium]